VAPAPIAWSFPVDSRVDHRVGAPDQLACGRLFPQRAEPPLDGVGLVLKPSAVTARPIPAAEAMSCVCEMPYEVAAKEACGTRDYLRRIEVGYKHDFAELESIRKAKGSVNYAHSNVQDYDVVGLRFSIELISKKTGPAVPPARLSAPRVYNGFMKTKRSKPGRKSRTPGVSRIDQPLKHNHGWYVRLSRRGKSFAKFFSDLKFGGKAKALKAAQKHYAQLSKANPPMSRQAFAQIERRASRTGIVGVSKVNGNAYFHVLGFGWRQWERRFHYCSCKLWPGLSNPVSSYLARTRSWSSGGAYFIRTR